MRAGCRATRTTRQLRRSTRRSTRSLRAIRWYTDPANHEEAVAIVARLNKAPPARLDWAFTGRDQFRDPNGTPNLKALQNNLQKQKQVGFLKDDIDVNKFADLSIVQAAAKRLT